MVRVAFVGWRGMVGSVLMQRMAAERDLDHVEPVFFSTSQAGGAAPVVGGRKAGPLQDASDVAALAQCDVVVSCQGGDYTNDIHPRLRAAGWKGYWIDAASALRMKDDAVIILDPVNRAVIDAALEAGVRDYIGGNCTVSLMMMALAGSASSDAAAECTLPICSTSSRMFCAPAPEAAWYVIEVIHSIRSSRSSPPSAISISDTVQLPPM